MRSSQRGSVKLHMQISYTENSPFQAGMKGFLLFIYFSGLTNVKGPSCSQQGEQPRHHSEPREIAPKSQQPPPRQPQPYQPYKEMGEEMDGEMDEEMDEMDEDIVDIVARDKAEADVQVPTLGGHDHNSGRRRRRAGYEKGKGGLPSETRRTFPWSAKSRHGLGFPRVIQKHEIGQFTRPHGRRCPYHSWRGQYEIRRTGLVAGRGFCLEPSHPLAAVAILVALVLLLVPRFRSGLQRLDSYSASTSLSSSFCWLTLLFLSLFSCCPPWC